MNTSPKVSIIIVVLNGAKTIENAINSVLQQTYKNFEIIIKDGLSDDDTIEILNTHHSKNFYWETGKDEGIYDAMNKAIMRASGEWIYFLGSDDTLYNSEVLSNVFAKEEHNDCDFIYGNIYSKALKKKFDGRFNTTKLLFKNISHQSIFYKKNIHDTIGYYETSYKTFADWHFNIKCFLDESVKKKYINSIIANFAYGGASTFNRDLYFLRQYLFPENLYALRRMGIKKLLNIKYYDNWWRLIRSMKLSDVNDDILKYADHASIPQQIKKIYFFQKKIPFKILAIGIISKSLMFISFCRNFFKI